LFSLCFLFEPFSSFFDLNSLWLFFVVVRLLKVTNGEVVLFIFFLVSHHSPLVFFGF
jgi:hypothetical protein